MSTADMTLPRRGLISRSLRGVIDLVIGGLLCLTPVTAIIVLGWLTRRMTARIHDRWGQPLPHPGWIMGQGGIASRLLGGLAANIRSGVLTLAGLFVWTAPFTVLWLGSWWAGWENSFNKGYEQAWVGPMVGLTGVAIASLILSHLPMALAHAAAEQRFGAFFELRRIRSVTKSAGWRGLWIALTSVIFALPLFGARALPVFIEDIVPGFADMTADAQLNVANITALLVAFWTFFALAWLRAMAARAYARSAPSAARGRDADLWDGMRAADVPHGRSHWMRPLGPVWFVLMAITWFGLTAQIFVGQFMNHDWALWITHPFFLLPWAG